MQYALTEVAAPTASVVNIDDLKHHLRIDGDYDNELLEEYLTAAERMVEHELDRQLLTATWKMEIHYGFPTPFIYVPRPKLLSVTSITYLDTDGVSQTLAADQYDTDLSSIPGHISPATDVTWPATELVRNAVTVNFTCGYGAAIAVPTSIKQAIKLIVGHFYQNRDATSEMPHAIKWLLDSERWMIPF